MNHVDDIKNFHDLKQYAYKLEHAMITLVGWLVQSHVFGQHDFDAFVEMFSEKHQPTSEQPASDNE